MKIICTCFDKSGEVPIPLYSSIYDTSSKDIEFLPLYMRGLKTKIKTIYSNLSKLAHTINTEPVFLNDAISHYRKFRQDINEHIDINADVCEYNRWLDIPIGSESDIKKSICKVLLSINYNPRPWMQIKAKSAIVYDRIEERGVKCGPYIMYPRYNTSTFTGRSKTYGYNIQGTTADDPIEHPDIKYDYIIHFDWVAADFRMASILSNDQTANACYEDSDPYQFISDAISNDDFTITRSECKNDLLKSMYSLSMDSPLLDVFPDLKSWMSRKIDEYKDERSYDFKTYMGMPIPRDEIKRSFNATIQGSIAEAIQCALISLYKVSKCILTETHDAIIIACTRSEIEKWMQIADSVIRVPFRQFSSDIIMPTNISIGRKWKNWKHYRTIQ